MYKMTRKTLQIVPASSRICVASQRQKPLLMLRSQGALLVEGVWNSGLVCPLGHGRTGHQRRVQ